MYIGTVEVNDTWQKLDELIQAQVSGQSEFSFDADTTYQLQAEGNFGIRLCEQTEEPGKKDGFRIRGTQPANYKVQAGAYLWVKVEEGLQSATPLLKISTLGE